MSQIKPVQDLTTDELLQEFSERMPEEWTLMNARLYAPYAACASQLFNLDTRSDMKSAELIVLLLEGLERQKRCPFLGKGDLQQFRVQIAPNDPYEALQEQFFGDTRLEAILRAWVFAKRQEAGE